MKFHVWIAGHATNRSVHGFNEIAVALVHSLRLLTNEVSFNPGEPYPSIPKGRLIVFGANTLRHVELPSSAIIFNAEQLKFAPSDYMHFLKFHTVWDYSSMNIAKIQALGNQRAFLYRIGYVEGLFPALPDVKQDIDVLHYGSINEHRQQTLEALSASGMTVMHLFGAYGEERDAFIARAKVCVNLHYYNPAIFEVARVSHLLNHGKCVVSEAGGIDTNLEMFANRATILVSKANIVASCKAMVDDDTMRLEAAARGFKAFTAIDQIAEIKRLLQEGGYQP